MAGAIVSFAGFGRGIGEETGVGIFPVGVANPGGDAAPGEFGGFAVESPGVVSVPEEADLVVIDEAH